MKKEAREITVSLNINTGEGLGSQINAASIPPRGSHVAYAQFAALWAELSKVLKRTDARRVRPRLRCSHQHTRYKSATISRARIRLIIWHDNGSPSSLKTTFIHKVEGETQLIALNAHSHYNLLLSFWKWSSSLWMGMGMRMSAQ